MYEIYEQLCRERGLSTADVCRATGISHTTIANWKKRRNLITGKNAKIIADFFGVSVDYLMTGETRDSYYEDERAAEMAEALKNNAELRILFDAAKDASPEDLKTVHDMLLLLKKRGKVEPED